MKLVARVIFVLALLPWSGFAGDPPGRPAPNDNVSYSIGYQIGGDFRRQGMQIDPESVAQGIRDAEEGTKPLLTPQEMNSTLVDLKKKIVAEQQARQKDQAAKNLQEGEAFLAENGRKEGVVTLPSGLQYQVIKEGSGDSPKATDNVTVHYRGALIDGTEFDSSYRRDKPATFRPDRVIAGWTEALQKMKEGAKWQLFIPSNLAYGERGAGSKIPPNATLIFEVELIQVN